MSSQCTSSMGVARGVLVAATIGLLALAFTGNAAASGGPQCIGLLPNSAIAKTMHVSSLSGPGWHVDGMPTTYCTYGPYPNELTVFVFSPGTVTGFRSELSLAPGKRQSLPAFSKHAVSVVHCVSFVGCDPQVIVLAKGHIVSVDDQLKGASAASLPKVEALVRQLLAKV